MKGAVERIPGIPEPVSRRAAELGQRVRAARIRRKWRREDLASRSGLSRTAVEAVENGKLSTGLGTYLRVLWALGLDREFDLLADPGLDRDGMALEFHLQSKRVRVQRKLDNDF
ncbi:helix-turn-helix domain-containing protein [Roseateles depolymerans]|uniref:helix-turn-helix domain-containing protein n=1 Tax=Roseateles depolymerans TaxID=76731 RepID=UPI0009F89F13|nr:helix-turn-helix domain-containing protein [Roseateles depolymerans]